MFIGFVLRILGSALTPTSFLLWPQHVAKYTCMLVFPWNGLLWLLEVHFSNFEQENVEPLLLLEEGRNMGVGFHNVIAH